LNNLCITLIAMALTAGNALACWEEAATKYGINAQLLYAIAKTESGLNPQAFNRNKNGSYDVGLMQINSICSRPYGNTGSRNSSFMSRVPAFRWGRGFWRKISSAWGIHGMRWVLIIPATRRGDCVTR
jgi:hypothetical protein